MNYTTMIREARTWALALMAVMLLVPVALSGQTATDQQNSTNTKETAAKPASVSLAVDSARKASDLPPAVDNEVNEGQILGGFEVKQSAEFGGRISDFTGSEAMWDTFVNLGSGPRLLEYTLDMRSPTHTGLLFDDFSFSNFGYGGDPIDVSRVRFSKGAAYTFSANFRRDQNVFDYNLFANPLNPPSSVPNIPILDSPHEFLVTRRMSDATLGLFPVGKIRFKLGWGRVVNEGTSFSSIHNGTDARLLQPTLNTTDNYSFGVSFRFIPRTAINFDQFFTHFKGDTTGQLASTPFFLPGNIPVDLGLPINSAANQPCSPTPVPIINAAGFVNPACSAFLAFARQEKIRTDYPTSQLSFTSNYLKRTDVSGRFSYSSADSDNPVFTELFNGLARNRQRVYLSTGNSNAQRIAASADFGITYRLTEKLHLVDTFRFNNFRIPTGWTYTTNNLFAANLVTAPNVFTPATCPPPFTAATCPQHLSGSAADITVDSLNMFLKQDSRINTFEVEYQFTPRISGYVGYRFERREIVHNDSDFQIQTFFPGPTAALANRGICAPAASHPLNPDGTCTAIVTDEGEDTTLIHAHSALFGFSARPTNKIRFSFDTEQFYADNTFTRISPRHLQIYKGRLILKPKEWWNFATSINIRENRNNTSDIGNLQHTRTYAFTTSIAPAEAKWAIDLSYDYNDIFSRTNVCFVASPGPANFSGSTLSCVPAGAQFISAVSTYSEASHIGSGAVVLNPIRRLTAAVGYTITSSNGTTLILNPIAPTGPLAFNYHLPTASLVFQAAKNLAFKGGWNYYGYNEKSDPGPTLPRDFRGNTFTVSVRYSM